MKNFSIKFVLYNNFLGLIFFFKLIVYYFTSWKSKRLTSCAMSAGSGIIGNELSIAYFSIGLCKLFFFIRTRKVKFFHSFRMTHPVGLQSKASSPTGCLGVLKVHRIMVIITDNHGVLIILRKACNFEIRINSP